jgi:DNA repair photolyase
MLQSALFPGLTLPPRGRCEPRREPQPRHRTPAVIDRLRWIAVGAAARRVLTTNVGLSSAEIAELARAARFGPIEIRFRIATPDRRLAAILDPHAPPPSLRLASLRAARRAGLVAGVVVGPLIPGVTANEADLRELVAKAKASGAAFVADEVVLPGKPRRDELARVLRARYPRVAARFEVWRRTSSRPPGEERTRVESVLAELRARFDLPREAPVTVGPPGSGSQRQFAFAV